MDQLRNRLRQLYFGDTKEARRFRYGLLAFDLIILCLFLASSFSQDSWWIIAFDLILGVLLLIEFAARIYAEDNRRRHLLTFTTLADILVIASLLIPVTLENVAFLRVFRALRVLRSYHLLRDLRAESKWFRLHEDIVQRTINLGVFLFVVTSAVYTTQHSINPQITNYIDALYFTITTLTTTGFGDITLQGPGGRLLAVIIMVVGVGLFLRLLQALFRPNKVRFTCEDCGLLIHDADAVHCKHCGKVLHIKTEGAV